MLMHASAYGAAHSGGSVSDRNLPPGTWISACAAISAKRSPSSRRRSGPPGMVRFSIVSRSRRAP